MTFASPWILALGLAAATIPVVVHLLTRPKPVRMPLSTLRFVREAVQQRRAAHWLRDFLILALRTLAILLIAIAFAGPRWGSPALIKEDAGDTVRVVVLDKSQSMAAADGKTTLMQRARSVAEKYLQYRSGLRSNVILAGAQPQAVFDNVSTNFEALREELARTDAQAEQLDIRAALELAARQLAPTDADDKRRRELIVISDFQRTNWGSVTFDALPPDTKIQLESVAPAQTNANLAVLRAVCRPLGARRDRLQLEVAIGNYSSTGREGTVEITLGDAVYALNATFPPQEVTLLTQEVPAPSAGWQWGETRLVDAADALPADDKRPLVIRLRGEPTYAIVTQQSEGGQLSSSRILGYGLAPEWDGEATSLRLERIDPSRLDNQSLVDADLITLDHCGKLSPEHIGLLARQIRLGHPVLYVTSEAVDAVNLNALATAAQIDLPVALAPPQTGTSRRDMHLAPAVTPRPPLAMFGDNLPALVDQLVFAGGLSASASSTKATDERIRAVYQDGTPAIIVATSAGGGSLAILNMDLAQSNIWKTGALVPILDELIQELLANDAPEEVYLSGEPLVARIDTAGAAQSLKIIHEESDGKPATPHGELVDDGDATIWQWNDPNQPGVYRVENQGETVFAAAVALPAEESDLSVLPAEVVRDRLAAGYEVAYNASSEKLVAQDDLWKWFTVGAVMCLLAEVAALLAFRN
ncbi:VWA domain-containing protein [Bremerella cremea]|uniref:VWA domain-containing protein n=1 Tax=Bremerella cremea TaxID=1031537 RepID=A0A368KUI4_9BACT|nr:BatA and WFA domain-containing protein [Bremerella cremea]RCS54090.1 VWA domain-containing protein [Bremerella cremea]